jgi:hypothetical protein
MDARLILTRGVSTGLRLGRGTADRVVTLAGPPLGRLSDRLVSKVRRPDQRGPTTFTPSKRQAEPEPAPTRGPSPAAVARNIGPPRPTAKPARPARPKSVPGAKLPPRRATTT